MKIVWIGLLLAAVWFFVRNIRQGKSSRYVVVANALTVLAAVVLFRFAYPMGFSYVVYSTLWVGLPTILAILLGAVIFGTSAWKLFKAWLKQERNSNTVSLVVDNGLLVVYGVLGLILLVGGWKLSHRYNMYRTANSYEFTSIDQPKEIDRVHAQFLTKEIAYNEIRNRYEQSSTSVEAEHIHPIDFPDGSYGFVAPQEPDGTLNSLWNQNPGYVILQETHGLAADKRNRLVEQKQVYGEGMIVFDNIWFHLYDVDPFTEYSEISYVELENGEIVAVASKIKYYINWGAMTPYWGGVVVLHGNGEAENLSASEAKSDPRLQGKRIFPTQLVRQISEALPFKISIFADYTRPDGQVRIPEIADLELPKFTRTTDGKRFWEVYAEPAGDSFATKKIYYFDATTGETLVWNVPDGSGLVGVEKGVKEVKSKVTGLSWVEDGGSDGKGGGSYRITDGHFLFVNGKKYFKYLITTKEHVGISCIALFNADTSETVFIKRNSTEAMRDSFFAWLNGQGGAVSELPGSIPETADPQNNEQLNDVLKQLEEATKKLRDVKDGKSSPPSPTK